MKINTPFERAYPQSPGALCATGEGHEQRPGAPGHGDAGLRAPAERLAYLLLAQRHRAQQFLEKGFREKRKNPAP